MENWVKWELGFRRILEFDGTNVRFSFGVPEGSHGEVSMAGVGLGGGKMPPLVGRRRGRIVICFLSLAKMSQFRHFHPLSIA